MMGNFMAQITVWGRIWFENGTIWRKEAGNLPHFLSMENQAPRRILLSLITTYRETQCKTASSEAVFFDPLQT